MQLHQLQQARYFEQTEGGVVRCILCPHHCILSEGQTGICGVRINTDGVLQTKIYGAVSAIAMDPIEKKPLFHFHPGSKILSIGTIGCNLKCPYCQNHHISQNPNAKTKYYSPEDIVSNAIEFGSVGIAFTYTEPLIWAEYVIDTEKAVRAKGLKNVLVTNGFIDKSALIDILSTTDAMNIDLKCFSDETFSKVHKGKLADVLNTIETAKSFGCHVELTTLIVSGINDSLSEMKQIISYIKSIDRSIPWHVSRYYPAWKYNAKPTETSLIKQILEETASQLDHVYCGNMASELRKNDTVCPSCGVLLVKRSGFFAQIMNELNKENEAAFCKKCGQKINLIL